MSIYSFRKGPSYRPMNLEEQFTAAMEQPTGLAANLWEQGIGGTLSSYGLGAGIREFTTPTPAGNPWAEGAEHAPTVFDYALKLKRAFDPVSPRLDKDAYKASKYFRDDIPWDEGMTEDRAASLAITSDNRKVREFYAEKRPISSFIGNLAGQALDPINYIPVAGPLFRTAAIARAGRVAGTALHASIDAAANTAVFGLATAGTREKYGEDVSWEMLTTDVAMAALIGGAFGTIGGAYGARKDRKATADIEARLATIQAQQEARIGLNEAIGAIANGEDINLSPNAIEPIARMAAKIEAEPIEMGLVGKTMEPRLKDAGRSDIEATMLARIFDNAYSVFAERSGKTVDEIIDLVGMPVGREQSMAPPAAVSEKVVDFSPTDPAINGGTVEAKVDNLSLRYAVKNPGEVELEPISKTAPSDADVAALEKLFKQADAENVTIKIDYESASTAGDASIYDAFGFKRDYIGPGSELIREPGAGLPAPRIAEGSIEPTADSLAALSKMDIPPEIRGVLDQVLGSRAKAPDTTTARPEPIPEGRDEAEASVGTPDDYKAIAEQYRVDPETGSYAEESDIYQMLEDGRLTEEDKADMAETQKDFENGAAYGEAMKSFATCLA